MSAYNVSKTAVIRMTETLASEAREHGISVFAMAPGLVRTDMPEEVGSSEAGRKWLPGFAENAKAHAQPPDRAAALCLSLASGVADVLSGRYISVRDNLAELVSRSQQADQDELRTLRLHE